MLSMKIQCPEYTDKWYKFDDIGYQNMNEMYADIWSWYSFWTQPRFKPLRERKESKTVLDKNAAPYKRHRAIELDRENLKLLFSNTECPKHIHSGNLGVECINSLLNSYNFTDSVSSIPLALSNAIIAYLSVNYPKLAECETVIGVQHHKIYEQIKKLMSNIQLVQPLKNQIEQL